MTQSSTVKRSEHDRKFDRQMRLWGGHGQRNLEEAHLCVLGAGPAASETLKNLVLPNVGEFTIIDSFDVTERDMGNNFFVTQDDLGKPRAETVTKWLLEMNPDVKGNGIKKDPIEVIEKDINSFDKFNVVISTNIAGSPHRKLGKYLYSKNIPYINIRIIGMMAYMRVQFKELTIMESHPTNDRTDFFIYHEQLNNFKELQEYIDSYDIDTKDVYKRPHIPCLAILGQYTKRWLSKHDNKLPSNFKEREEFKDGIRELGDDENFDDAVRWAYQCYFPPRIDNDVKQVLEDKNSENLDKNSSDFWILVKSLKDYMNNEGKGFLPVSTNIPDITMDSKSYVTLKKIFKERAGKDLQCIATYVKKNLKSLNKNENSIDDRIIERFVKNCRSLKVVRTKSIEDEINNPDCSHIDEKSFDMNALLGGNDDSKDEEKPYNPLNIHWYLAFRTIDLFWDKYKRLPGIEDKDIETDTNNLVELQKTILKDLKLENELNVDLDCLSEISRYGGSQIHNTGAFIGGVAASLIMKLLLKQFFPYNHTYVYNGIYCSGDVFTV